MGEPTRQREHYRVEYPLRERPTLVLEGEPFEVIECSESGLRYSLGKAGVQPPVGSPLRGVVRFPTSAEIPVSGVVARVDEGRVAVRFSGTGIPFATVMAEQIYLRRKYLGRSVG